MQLKGIVASAFLISALPLAASAQDADRYTLEKSGNAYVRMDRKTGEMSICEERTGQLVCRLAADERAAFQDELDRFQDRLSSLEKRVVELETASRPNTEKALPTEEEFEKSLGYMERFFRRFMDIVRDLDKTWRQGEPEGQPQKT
jgi:wyosine [tRNA(Phe)-imidazoG37] synthetase (radical SAM superfamily)